MVKVLIFAHVEVREGKGVDCVPQILAWRNGRYGHQLGRLARFECGLAPAHQVLGAVVAVVVITATGFALHRRVERLSDELEEL